jgi:hypothetical protein
MLIFLSMFKSYGLLFLFTLAMAGAISAQNPGRVSIQGSVKDTLGEVAGYATVMLLNPADSTLACFTTTNENGAFNFSNVKNIPYILKISHVSYIPLQVPLGVSSTPVHDLKQLTIKPISQTLMEVVIRAAKAPLYIKGDTIEYDATTFKVPPGSTVEDLLRRLPGIEVDADGNIKTQGEDVKRVYVDGKSFFGDDPKSVTKNLEAEAISRVQVYDDKSEQAKLTGVDDGSKEKAMNLALKEEFKKGSFGKATLAGGNDERWAARGNFNRFDEKNQLSFIGYANNINQTGVNWEDYGEFKGQNTFNDFDNGDFGFNGGGGRMFFFSGEDSPLNNFDGRGFTRNAGAGTNYNFDNRKTKFTASYFYNQTKLNFDQYTFRQTFLADSSYFNNDTTTKEDFRGTHSIGTRFERNLDSSDVVIAKANFRFSTNNSTSMQGQLFSSESELPVNRLSMGNESGLDSWRITTTAIYRHRFKKKGQSFAMSAGYNNSLSDGTEELTTLNEFFQATTVTGQIKQLNVKANAAQQLKSSLLFTLPVIKNWYWESFYNFSLSTNGVNRQVKDLLDGQNRIDSLSVYYDNTVLYNRLGTSLRFSNKGLNLSFGAAAQQLRLDGKYSVAEGEPLLNDPIQRSYLNWTPNVSASYQLPRNMWIETGYSYEVNEPDISYLQPIPNVNNPLYRIEGNPDLEPEKAHSFRLHFNYWNAASFSNFSIGSNYNIAQSSIVYNQDIEFIEGKGLLTTSTPANVKGGSSFNTYLWSNLPVIKTKLSVGLNGNISFSNARAFINAVENRTDSKGYNLGMNLNLTPGQKLVLSLEGRMNNTNIAYSIRKEQNQKIRNWDMDASMKWQFASKMFFESSFTYSIYRNERFGFNQDIPLWNGSVRKLFGKKNRVEMRLAAFDILNKRVYLQQYGSANYILRTSSPTLARYFMFSVSYNLRGFEDKLKKNNFF